MIYGNCQTPTTIAETTTEKKNTHASEYPQQQQQSMKLFFTGYEGKL